MDSEHRAASRIAIFHGVSLVAFGLAIAGAEDVLAGLLAILTARDALLIDYIGVGGVGAASVNAGSLMLFAVAVNRAAGVPISGPSLACLYLLTGFGFFGKNLLNVPLIVLGVYLGARARGETFARNVDTAFFCCALAPVVSEIMFSTALPRWPAIGLALLAALAIGCAAPPTARQVFRTHEGFSLFNMGFAAGIVGVLAYGLLRSYDLVPEPVTIWTTGRDPALLALLLAILLSLGLGGLLAGPRPVAGLRTLWRLSGQAPTDFVREAGLGATLLNMALTGGIGLGYVCAVGADLNGPTAGAILTVAGFAAFGKHPVNAVPVMLGVLVAALAKSAAPGEPALVLAALFGTTLAPIAGRFGWHWGVAAGFLHAAAALVVGETSTGLNLYNNGFAAGIVAAVLVPVIRSYAAPPPGEASDR